jgi:hypothetical protein
MVYLHLGHLADAFIQSDLQLVHFSEERETVGDCLYSKDVHITKCQALTIFRGLHLLFCQALSKKSCVRLKTIYL